MFNKKLILINSAYFLNYPQLYSTSVKDTKSINFRKDCIKYTGLGILILKVLILSNT